MEDEVVKKIKEKYSTIQACIELKRIETDCQLHELIKSNQDLKSFAFELHLFNKRTREKVNIFKSKLKFEDCLNGMLIYYYNMCLINFNYFQKMNINFLMCKNYANKLADCLNKIQSFNLKLNEDSLKLMNDLNNLSKIIDKHYLKKANSNESLKSLIELGDLDKIDKYTDNIEQEAKVKVYLIKLINMLNQNENDLTLRTSNTDAIENSFNLSMIFNIIGLENLSKSYMEYAKIIHIKQYKK